jgi:hypothetical protein
LARILLFSVSNSTSFEVYILSSRLALFDHVADFFQWIRDKFVVKVLGVLVFGQPFGQLLFEEAF